MQIRIVALAPKVLSDHCKFWAKKLSQFSKSYFWVDGKKLAHHITLFDIACPPKKLTHLEEVIKNLISDMPALKLPVEGLWRSPAKLGYVGLQIKPTKGLLNVRKKLFKALKDYQPTFMAKKYIPHITLARYKDFVSARKVGLNEKIKNTYSFNTLALTKVDRHGQVYKILKIFKFK